MTTLKDFNDKQLLQALQDAENEVQRLQQEIKLRGVLKYGSLFNAIGDATRKALDRPSWMDRSRKSELDR